MNKKTRTLIQNIAILTLVIIGIKNIAIGFLPQHTPVHGVLSYITGAVIIILANRLYKRIQMAWLIEIMGLTVSVVLQITRRYVLSGPIAFIEVIILLILIFSYKDFSRKSDRITVKKALIFMAISLILLLVNAGLGIYTAKTDFRNIKDLYGAFAASFKLLFFMDESMVATTSRAGGIYIDSVITLNWICIVFSLMLLLKPLVYNRVASKMDKERAREIVLKYGQNPMSYLALEDDKKYFFGNNKEGLCAYDIVGKTMVCCGDIICKKEDAFDFLTEIMEFCRQNDLDLVMINVTDYFMDLYKTANFGSVKYGEDACFDLESYSLAGGRVAKVRAAINHANKKGVYVEEYRPGEKKNVEIEKEIEDISRQWLAEKNSPEMKFMLGTAGLRKPMDRRYFYARDPEGRMLGFAVFLPYQAKKAYLADVTRRKKDAPQGVLEKIIYEAFMKFKEEGVESGNMGLSPLYNVAEGDKVAITEQVFAYVYDNMNSIYSFKTLHHSKEKFAPTQWKPRYLVYHTKPFKPQYAYAIIKVQNPKGIHEFIKTKIGKKPQKED